MLGPFFFTNVPSFYWENFSNLYRLLRLVLTTKEEYFSNVLRILILFPVVACVYIIYTLTIPTCYQDVTVQTMCKY